MNLAAKSAIELKTDLKEREGSTVLACNFQIFEKSLRISFLLAHLRDLQVEGDLPLATGLCGFLCLAAPSCITAAAFILLPSGQIGPNVG